MDPLGNLYVSDSQSNLIRKYDYSNNYYETTFAVGFNQPRQLSWNIHDDSLLVLDFGNNRIRRVKNGAISTVYDMPTSSIGNNGLSFTNNRIQAMAVRSDSATSEIYASLMPASAGVNYGGQIMKMDKDGGNVKPLVKLPGTLKQPISMGVGPNGTVYVGNLNGSISSVTNSESESGTVKTFYTGPTGINSLTFDKQGNLWVSAILPTPNFQSVLKFSSLDSATNPTETPTVMVSRSASNAQLNSDDNTAASYMGIVVNEALGGLFIAEDSRFSVFQIPSLSASKQIRSRIAGTGISGIDCLQGHAITVKQSPGGKIAPESMLLTGTPASQRFTVTPDDSYKVKSITIDGVELSETTTLKLSDVKLGGVTFTYGPTVETHTVTATYTPPAAYSITYNNNATYNGVVTTGNLPGNQSLFAGSTITLKGNTGSLASGTAVLTGWNTIESGTGSSYSLGQTSVRVDTDTVLFAQWAGPITYQANTGAGSQTSDTYTVSTGSVTFPVSTTFTRTGFSFGGWADSSTSTTPLTSHSTLSAVNRYAIWTHNEYAVTFYKNNESATGTMAVESKTAATLLTANTFLLTDRVFDEWNTAADGSGTPIRDGVEYHFSASISLYAQWGNIITYSTLGADSGSPSKLSETWISGAISLPTANNMVKAGYSLGGWRAGATTYTDTYTPTTGITLNPVWTPNTYTVSFNKSGGTGTLPSDQTWSESTTALTLSGNTGTLVKDGNTWGGWAESSSGRSAITTFSSTSETLTMTLYAIWNLVPYSVNYDLNGGAGDNPTETTHTINETFTVAATPTKDTFVFGGWNDGLTDYSAGSSYTVETSTVTLTAKWIATYTVHYIMNGSTTTPAIDARYASGTPITTEVAPTRIGYTFAHWSASSTETYTAGSSFAVIIDSNLIAEWIPVDYSITYLLDGGTSTPPTHAVVNINDTFNLDSAAPIKAGYSFKAWFDGADEFGSGASHDVGSANITLTARWTAIDYSVTYDLGGGTGTRPSHAAVNIGDTFTVSIEVDPTWRAHTFAGWSDGGPNTYTKVSTYTASSSNITLTAVWTLNGYTTISYALGGGSGTLPTHAALLEDSEFEVASGIGLAKTGQAFNGWNDATKTYQLNEIYIVGPAPIVLTAQWATGYSVTYIAGTGSGTVPTDAVLRLPSATFTLASGSTLSRSGYTFAGWNDGVGTDTYLGGTSQTIGSADLIYTAQWTFIVVTAPPAQSEPVRKVEVEPLVIVVVKLTSATEMTFPIVAAQIALIKDQSAAKDLFPVVPTIGVSVTTQLISSPSVSQINNIGVLTSINTQSATTNSLQTANFKLPANDIILSDLVVKALELQVKLVATDTGFSVKPVAGFTGVLVIPIVATIDGVQITVLNRVVVNPVAPVAIGFTPKSVKASAISWTPSASQVVAYVVEVNGKTLCQTTSSSCPVPALIGPNSKVTISAVGNDQTSSAPEEIPYIAKVPIPALTVAFALNSSRLSDAQKIELRRVAKIIDREGFTRLVVSGFTDAQGSAAANKVLSAARAKATAAFLAELLPDITLKISSYGARKPVKAGTSATAYGANRRSEIGVW